MRQHWINCKLEQLSNGWEKAQRKRLQTLPQTPLRGKVTAYRGIEGVVSLILSLGSSEWSPSRAGCFASPPPVTSEEQAGSTPTAIWMFGKKVFFSCRKREVPYINTCIITLRVSQCNTSEQNTNHAVPGSIPGSTMGIFPYRERFPWWPWSG